MFEHRSQDVSDTRSRLARLFTAARAAPPGDPPARVLPPVESPEESPEVAGSQIEWWLPGAGRHRAGASRDAVQTSVALPRRTLAVAAVAVVVAVVAVAAVLLGRGPEPQRAPPPLPAAHPGRPSSTVAAQRSAVVVVSVVGKVRRPGLVRLRAGARVADALKAAGGAKRGVDLTTVNLARRVADGEQIHVGAAGAAGAAGTPGTPGAPGVAAPGAKVNLNSATAEQLEELPGIGEVTAGNILDWRARHGGFTAVEQLREVDGIGERRLAVLRERVVV
ncbi:MAG: helix-hairpin-helix domain-containing protein [Thermocrispum sp.]